MKDVSEAFRNTRLERRSNNHQARRSPFSEGTYPSRLRFLGDSKEVRRAEDIRVLIVCFEVKCSTDKPGIPCASSCFEQGRRSREERQTCRRAYGNFRSRHTAPVYQF